MRHKTTFALFFLAVSQWALLGILSDEEDTGILTPPLRLEDSLEGLVLINETGESLAFPTGEPMLLLTYDPRCRFSNESSEFWVNWLSRSDPHLRVLLVSAHPELGSIRTRFEDNGRLEFWAPSAKGNQSRARQLFRRVPWVFLVGSSGKVLAESHGRTIEQVAEVHSGVSAF